jgi:magnesium transporter
MITPEITTEEVSYLFKQYGYVSLPVISKNKRIIGVVTIDDAMELIEKEAEEDIMLMGGVNDADFHSDIFKTFKSRFPWLFINLVTASLSAFVIASFEGTIAQIVALASIMPIVSSMGGNAGTQTMTLSLIAVTSKEISRLNISRIVIKQLIANILNGSAIALIGGLCVAFIQSDFQIGIIFAISVVINFTIAGFFGTMLPIVLKRMKIDPLVPSPILMTALTDMGGFLVFLGLATFFLL